MGLGLGRRITRREDAPVRWTLVRAGWIPKWPKGPDCKSGGTAFAGSNPAPPTAGPSRNESPTRKDAGLEYGSETIADRDPATAEYESRPADRRPTCRGRTVARGCNSMVEYLPSKQATWVRFPSPALGPSRRRSRRPILGSRGLRRLRFGTIVEVNAAVAQLVERVLGKDEVLGSNPSGSFRVVSPKSGRCECRTQRSAPGRWVVPPGADHC